MTDTNHIGDINEMVGDAVAKCEFCGVPWAEHMGIMGVCATNARLRKERDEARREVCDLLITSCKDAGGFWDPEAHTRKAKVFATSRGWDCFKEKTQ